MGLNIFFSFKSTPMPIYRKKNRSTLFPCPFVTISKKLKSPIQKNVKKTSSFFEILEKSEKLFGSNVSFSRANQETGYERFNKVII